MARHIIAASLLVPLALGSSTPKDASVKASGDSQKYMKQYAGNHGDYQKYTKQYAGQGGNRSSSSNSAQSSSADYQKYMKQYAGKSGDYQQYMQQYAGSKGNNTPSAQGSSGDYQKYMKQYAGQSGDYQKYMKQYTGGSSGSSQGGDYQKYYQTYMKSYASGNSSSGYQKYIEQYGSNNENSSAVTLYSADQAKNKEQLESWKKQQTSTLQKYMPSAYSHYATQNIEQQYNKRLAELTNSTINLEEVSDPCTGMNLYSAEQAENKDQLECWKKSQMEQMNYVPSDYRHFGQGNVDKSYKKRLSELEGSNGTHAINHLEQHLSELEGSNDPAAEDALNLEELPAHSRVAKNASQRREELDRQAETAVQHVEHIAASVKQAAKDRATIQKHAALPAQSAATSVAKQRAALEAELTPIQQRIKKGTVDKDDLLRVKHAEASIDALEHAEKAALRAETHSAEKAARQVARNTQQASRQAAREARKRTDALAHVAHGRADELDRRAEEAADVAENYAEQLTRSNEDELQRQRTRAEEQVHRQAEENRASLKTSRTQNTKSKANTNFLASDQESRDGSAWSAGIVLLAVAGSFALLAILAHHSKVRRAMPRVPEHQLG